MDPRGEDYFVKRSVGTEKDTQSHPQRPQTSGQTSAQTNGTSAVHPEKNGSSVQKRNVRTEPDERRKLVPKVSASGGAADVPAPLTKEEKRLERKLAIEKFIKVPEGYKAGNVDMVFLVLLVLLLAFGAVMSFSASYAYAAKKYGDSYYFVERQLLFTLFGAISIVIVTLFPLKTYRMVTYAIFGVATVLLLLVLVMGSTRGGAKRWLEIPGFGSFQPSELGKTALVMMLSLYLAEFSEKIESKNKKTSFLFGIVFPALFIGFIGGLVVLEKHFSGLIIICCIGLCEMVLGGSKLKIIIPIGLAAAGAIALFILLTDYSSTRIEVWLDPWKDPGDTGWQTIQGLYTIASGGIFGVGLGNSRQKYGYVSEPQNDFVFTIVCEELGFIGAVAVMLLFLLLIWRGFVIARNAPNRFTYLIVMGLMVKIALQVIFNIAVVTNTIPNTGISLPFFSSGGTSLLVQMAEMGIVLSISRYSRNPK